MPLPVPEPCASCRGGAAATPDFTEPDGTVSFRRCRCGMLHVRHYDGYWWTSPNGYNLSHRLEQWDMPCEAPTGNP